MTFGAQGYALARGEGEGSWFFNGRLTVKAGGPDTRQAFTLIEAELPAGEGPPPHIHHDEDEGFYVLEGEVSITCGDQTWTAVPGLASGQRAPAADHLICPVRTLRRRNG